MGILDRFKKDKDAETVAKPKSVKKAEVKQAADKPKKAAPKKEKKEKKAAPVGSVDPQFDGVILRPLVTEKAARLATDGQYVFVVHPRANRIQVRGAVKALYGVIPASVNIQNVHGKRVRFGRTRGQRNAWKKAIVTLPKGKTIDVYEGV